MGDFFLTSKLEETKQILREQNASCVIQKPSGEVVISNDFGIKPLMIELRKDKQAFQGAVIADRVIGKAAALLTVLGGACEVYGEIMSQAACEVLDANQIIYEYGEKVPYIENRTKTGKCPMEETVWEIDDVNQAFEALEATIARLMK